MVDWSQGDECPTLTTNSTGILVQSLILARILAFTLNVVGFLSVFARSSGAGILPDLTSFVIAIVVIAIVVVVIVVVVIVVVPVVVIVVVILFVIVVVIIVLLVFIIVVDIVVVVVCKLVTAACASRYGLKSLKFKL